MEGFNLVRTFEEVIWVFNSNSNKSKGGMPPRVTIFKFAGFIKNTQNIHLLRFLHIFPK